jgi:Transposase zinc-binding domain/Putative transposase
MLAACQRPAAVRGGVELADIFRAYGAPYRRNQPLPVSHRTVMQAVERCRTAALGGHIERCDSCGFERPAYNSCRNRHCPKCQSLAKVRWLEKQKSELLPVGYFHLVFTLPHELNRLILANKKTLINILFQSVSKTLAKFAQSHLRGTLGIIAVLHTWDQTLLDHFHLHCLLPAGALSFDQSRWMSARQNFLFPVKALSVVFRAKFLDLLKQSFDQNKLLFAGQIAPLADAGNFNIVLKGLRKNRGSSTPKNLSALPTMSLTTSAATPTAWRSPMIGFSQPMTGKSLLVTGTEKIRTKKRPCPSMPTNLSAASCST